MNSYISFDKKRIPFRSIPHLNLHSYLRKPQASRQPNPKQKQKTITNQSKPSHSQCPHQDIHLQQRGDTHPTQTAAQSHPLLQQQPSRHQEPGASAIDWVFQARGSLQGRLV
ncbi:hypothetical protein BCR33DRAFT_232082 [Rhizoclosmatium globosum]|uniref:Uncharacterized protein n=1 Tax=Rhizoclosmatium globosum TaxID=329046 RepID=A0A1Y2CA98_9FUNG|nr:hypothetical protein BCR33DRAFT_232082 [Rhizoclosmatium globosum]|eukprot:ORY43950.1 hypothetical protein BCR33DRAFT_232082 [Rhizoclosmatium globosum]